MRVCLGPPCKNAMRWCLMRTERNETTCRCVSQADGDGTDQYVSVLPGALIYCTLYVAHVRPTSSIYSPWTGRMLSLCVTNGGGLFWDPSTHVRIQARDARSISLPGVGCPHDACVVPYVAGDLAPPPPPACIGLGDGTSADNNGAS